MSKRGLGRGLGALLPSTSSAQNDHVGDITETVIEIPVKDIRVNPHQPRHSFNREKLEELAASIKQHGVVQPIIVRLLEDGTYELVAGERRWRASQLIGIKKIPAIVKKLSEKETSEIALIENIQREDLNPIEEAVAYKTLMEEYGLTQDELSKRVGKSRPFIANTVRLLSLPDGIRRMVAEGAITAGHARALLALPTAREQEEVARKIASRGLSVRQTEDTVKELLSDKKKARKKTANEDPIIKELEERLQKAFSTKVRIKHGPKLGKIEIEYYGDEDLQRLLEELLDETEM